MAGCNTPIHDIDLKRKDYNTKTILFVGVTWERKGGPELVKAFEKVLRVHPDARLVIVGYKPKVDLPNVQIIGRLTVDELVPYYQQASIFCLPTKLEPFGIVFVEAMAFGLPLVAPRTGAVPDFVEDGRNGFMVEPGDIDALAEALIKLLDDPQLCRKFGEVRLPLGAGTLHLAESRPKNESLHSTGALSAGGEITWVARSSSSFGFGLPLPSAPALRSCCGTAFRDIKWRR